MSLSELQAQIKQLQDRLDSLSPPSQEYLHGNNYDTIDDFFNSLQPIIDTEYNNLESCTQLFEFENDKPDKGIVDPEFKNLESCIPLVHPHYVEEDIIVYNGLQYIPVNKIKENNNLTFTNKDMDSSQRQIIHDTLKKNRPKLSLSSLKTYTSIISSLYKRLNASGNPIDFFSNNATRVINDLKDMDGGARKTKLAGLVSLMGNHKSADAYRDVMLQDIHNYDTQQKDGRMSASQKENWVSWDEVKQLYESKALEAKHLLSKKTTLTKSNLQDLQDFVILSLFYLIEPRRILDYTEFKVRNINESEDNYMKGNTFVFNKYKTHGTYGKQVVKIPPLLNSIIRRYTQLHTNDYLLFSIHNGQKLQQPQLVFRLNSIFGKKTSVNILRHSFLTEKYRNMPQLLDMEKTAHDMGHSVEQAMLYRKTDPSIK
jgi:hypothetical protein